MILPAKHLRQHRSMLGIGSDILAVLADEQTVSEVWERVQERRREQSVPLMFDWFVLALSFLYAIEAIEYRAGILSKKVMDDN